MSAQLLDGLGLARQTREELKARVARLAVRPRLEVVVAAQDPSSLAYVRMKRKWAGLVGIEAGTWEVLPDTTTEQVLDHVAKLNADSGVHGVLVQHPLPSHIDEQQVLVRLGARKDVDGISPESLGRLLSDLPGFRAATPAGIMHLLDHAGIELKGKRAVVIGRSVILGKPMALLLLQRHATVTIAHSRTLELPEVVRQADVVVAAVGKPEFIRGDWVKPGAVVVDAGYNRVEGRDQDVGDCAFAECASVASWITPVPGGVGPMTVATLLRHVVEAAEAAS